MECTHRYRVDTIAKIPVRYALKTDWVQADPLHTDSFVEASNHALRVGNAVVYDSLLSRACMITHQLRSDCVQVYMVSSFGEVDIHERVHRMAPDADYIID